ncbi:ferrous iron transporter B, partial [Candidatus Bathyarchaeota archaeon]
IDREKDRILTILINPLMSCSARLPVYLLIGGAVLGPYAAAGTHAMYVLGVSLAVLVAVTFRKVVPYFKGKPSPFIMELPLYSVPNVKSTLLHTWERGSLFLKKAGTIILIGIIFVWFLSSYPWNRPLNETYMAALGRVIEPFFRPLGFDWKVAVSLFFGFIAKEIVVGTFAVIFGLESEDETQDLQETLRSYGVFTPLTGLAFMAFTLIYVPCIATLGAIYRETNSWKWTIFTVVYSITLAYLVSLTIVTVGWFLGYG